MMIEQLDSDPHPLERRMRRSGLVAILGFMLAVAGVHAAPPVQRVEARQLVRTTLAALEGVGQAAQGPTGRLDPRNPRHSAFLAALGQFQGRVQTIDRALAQPGEELFNSIDLGSSDLGALRVSWARAGVSQPQIAEGIRIASESYRMLRANYGREGLRQQQGGGLSPAEARQLQRVRQAQRRFAESLRALRAEAQRRGDRATTAELDRFRAEAERIARASQDLESYLNALIISGELRGEWAADRPYVQKAAAPKKVAAADQAVEDLYVDSDIGQVFAVNLGSESEGPSSQGDAVQVYQAADGEAEPAVVVESDGSDRADGSVGFDDEVEAQEPAMEEVSLEPADAAAEEEALEVVEPTAPATPVEPALETPAKAPPTPPADPPKPPPMG
jgi:hypothetical protein